MGVPVGELMERMPARELDDWMTYARLEPFGEERADLRMGILASVIANSNRDAKQRPDPFEPADFIPDFAKASEPPVSRTVELAQALDREAAAERMYEQKMRAAGKASA